MSSSNMSLASIPRHELSSTTRILKRFGIWLRMGTVVISYTSALHAEGVGDHNGAHPKPYAKPLENASRG